MTPHRDLNNLEETFYIISYETRPRESGGLSFFSYRIIQFEIHDSSRNRYSKELKDLKKKLKSRYFLLDCFFLKGRYRFFNLHRSITALMCYPYRKNRLFKVFHAYTSSIVSV